MKPPAMPPADRGTPGRSPWRKAQRPGPPPDVPAALPAGAPAWASRSGGRIKTKRPGTQRHPPWNLAVGTNMMDFWVDSREKQWIFVKNGWNCAQGGESRRAPRQRPRRARCVNTSGLKRESGGLLTCGLSPAVTAYRPMDSWGARSAGRSGGERRSGRADALQPVPTPVPCPAHGDGGGGGMPDARPAGGGARRPPPLGGAAYFGGARLRHGVFLRVPAGVRLLPERADQPPGFRQDRHRGAPAGDLWGADRPGGPQH